jgi:dihydropteroate synthase
MRSFSRPGPETARPPLRFRAPRLMGVVNATPDSFYPASRAAGESAVERGLRLIEDGADMIDVGGQSTRPGSDRIPVEDELARVIPVVRALAARARVPISVDTDKAAVAAAALDAGARIVNDVSALRADAEMARVAARAERVVLMHMLGESPKTMQDAPRYDDVVRDVREFLDERLEAFAAAGGDPARVWIDPGVGFGKRLQDNLALIKHVGDLAAVAPVLLGVSRKSFLGAISPDAGPEDRLSGSLAIAAWAGFAGVEVLRVHDVAETKRALEALSAVAGAA